MTKKRRVFQDDYKVKVPIAALIVDKMLAELSSQFAVHVNPVSAWRAVLAERASKLFRDGRARPSRPATRVSLARSTGTG